jgi:hypothetical protein
LGRDAIGHGNNQGSEQGKDYLPGRKKFAVAMPVHGKSQTLLHYSDHHPGRRVTMERLFIRVDDGQDPIHGVVVRAGLQAAFNELVAKCPWR